MNNIRYSTSHWPSNLWEKCLNGASPVIHEDHLQSLEVFVGFRGPRSRRVDSEFRRTKYSIVPTSKQQRQNAHTIQVPLPKDFAVELTH